jgi:hypothetical protein
MATYVPVIPARPIGRRIHVIDLVGTKDIILITKPSNTVKESERVIFKWQWLRVRRPYAVRYLYSYGGRTNRLQRRRTAAVRREKCLFIRRDDCYTEERDDPTPYYEPKYKFHNQLYQLLAPHLSPHWPFTTQCINVAPCGPHVLASAVDCYCTCKNIALYIYIYIYIYIYTCHAFLC